MATPRGYLVRVPGNFVVVPLSPESLGGGLLALALFALGEGLIGVAEAALVGRAGVGLVENFTPALAHPEGLGVGRSRGNVALFPGRAFGALLTSRLVDLVEACVGRDAAAFATGLLAFLERLWEVSFPLAYRYVHNAALFV